MITVDSPLKSISKSKVLLVDNDPIALNFLKNNIEKEGFLAYTAENGNQAISVALIHQPHLIILDVIMPEMDGIETCIRLRKSTKLKNTLIAFLTERNEDYSQIAGFDAGADDYISKPIKHKLLISRIKALLRNKDYNSAEQHLEDSADITIHPEQFLVVKKGQNLSFPKKQFTLLKLLMSKPDYVFSRQAIIKELWARENMVDTHIIDVHIRQLREKLGNQYIQTIKGVGYKFVTAPKPPLLVTE